MKNRKIALTSLLSMTLLAVGCGNHDISSTDSSTKPSETPSTEPASQSSVIPTEEFAITIDAGEGATIQGLPEKAAEGTTVSFTVSLEAEKNLSYVTMDGENVLEADQNGTFSFVMPKKAVTVSAVTADKRYAIRVNQIPGATVAVSSTLAKKGEEITIRVAVTDPLKSTPNVTVDGTDIIMDAATDAVNTYVGSFLQEGKDVDVEVTLNDAPVAKNYGVTVNENSHISVGGLKEHYHAGDTVTFTLGVALGYEPKGDVEVKDANDSVIAVTKNNDGTYSFTMPASNVVISMETGVSIFGISKNMTNVAGSTENLLTAENIVVPEYAKYGEVINFSVTPNNYYEADVVTVDGDPVVNNGGTYSFTMKDRAVNIDVQAKVRYAPITLTNSAHVTLSAYVLDSEGNYVLANEATYNQKVYIKATSTTGDDGTEYGIKKLTARYGSESYNTVDLTLNSDGYYEKSGCYVRNMNYGLSFTLEETTALFAEDAVFLGLHKGYQISTFSNYSGPTSKTYELNRFGKIDYNGSEYWVSSVDENAKTFQYSSYTNYFFDNGTLVRKSDYSLGYFEIYAPVSNAYEITSLKVLADTSSLTDSKTNNILSSITTESETYLFFLTKSGSDTLVYSDITINYLSGSDFNTNGSIFEIKEGNNVIASFKNVSGLLTPFTKGTAGTFTGTFGELVIDGICSGSLNGEAISYETVNSTTIFVKVTSTYMEYAFTLTDSTYAEDKVNYPFSGTGFTGIYNGTYTSYMKKNGELNGNYKARLTLDGAFDWDGRDIGKISKSDDGSYISGSYVIHFAPDGSGLLFNTGSTFYYLTKILTENYGSTYLSVSFITLGKGYINAAKKRYESDWNTYLYYDGTDYQFVTLDFASDESTDFTVDGAIYSVIGENGETLFSGSTQNGAFVKADTHKGTYTGDNGDLVLTGYGTGTLGDANITYWDGEGGSVLVKNGLTTYTMTLGEGTYTITDTVTLSIPSFIAGHVFQGQVYDNDGDPYTLFIGFASDEFTLSCSAGYGASSSNLTGGSYLKNENVTYTIEDDILTVTLNETETGTISAAISFVIDEENKTLTPSSSQNLGYYNFVPSSSFTQVAS